MPTKPTKRARWAFWSYDLFPFVLSGRIACKVADGYEIEGYGKGWIFRRVNLTIVAGKKGEQLANDLDTLRAEYGRADAALRKGFTARARALIPFADKLKYLNH